jgi:hypothetical protein
MLQDESYSLGHCQERREAASQQGVKSEHKTATVILHIRDAFETLLLLRELEVKIYLMQ